MKFGFSNLLSSLIVLAITVVAVALLVHYRTDPPVVPFAPFDVHVILNVVGGLFVVALMTERAIEVIISVLRDADAQKHESEIETTTAALAAAKAAAVPSQAEIDRLTAKLSLQKDALEAYKVDTRETTYCISFTLGIAMAVVGVRGLFGILAPGAGPLSGWFKLVDIVVTGAVIAGGSDGIHKMVKAVLDFFGMISATMAKRTASASNP